MLPKSTRFAPRELGAAAGARALRRAPAFVPSLLILGSAFVAGPAFADELAEKEIHPFLSDSELLGATAAAPFVGVNEYTGKVSASLPPIGPPGLQVTPSYIAPNRDWEILSAPGADVGADTAAVHEPVGLGWHLHFGYLATRKAWLRTPTPEDPLGFRAERVVLMDSSGAITAFERDGIFPADYPQPSGSPQCPETAVAPSPDGGSEESGNEAPVEGVTCTPIDNVRDAHFVDAGLRRLTRPVNQAFGTGRYYLLHPDGSRAIYEASAYKRDAHFARYYPVILESATGRQLRIEYVAPLSMPGLRPQIDTVTDGWGRRLRFEYAAVAGVPGRSFVREIWLERSDGSEARLQAELEQEAVPLPSGGTAAVLRRMKSPEGRTFSFEMAAQPGEAFPFLERLTLPEGGTVELGYKPTSLEVLEADCLISPCNLWPNGNPVYFSVRHTQTRVRFLQHSGGSYAFSYQQRPEGELQPGADTDGRLRVTVRGDEGYERVSEYYSPSYDPRRPPSATFAGQLEWREESYRGTRKRETWAYAEYDYGRLEDHSSVSSTVVERYSLELDGVWTDTLFTYPYPGPYGIFPTRVERRPRRADGSASEVAVVQTFTYQHRARQGFGYRDDAYGDTYQLGLERSARERLTKPGQPAETLGLVTTQYDPVWPVPLFRAVHALEPGSGQSYPFADALNVHSVYHRSGPEAGLVSSRSVGGAAYATAYPEYLYDVPLRESPPATVDTVRRVQLDGNVLEETAAGVRVEHVYDRDGRRVRTLYPLDLDEEVYHDGTYQPQAPAAGANLSTTVVQGERWRQTDLDAWGRQIADHGLVDGRAASYRVGTGESHFSPLGFEAATIGPHGGRVETDVDVHGRPTEIRSLDDLGTLLARQQFTYRTDPDTGESTVEEVASGDAGQDLHRTRTHDLAGRLVRGATHGHPVEIERRPALLPSVGKVVQEVRYRPWGRDASGVLVRLPERIEWRDQMDRVLREEHPETGPVEYRYDSRGLLSEQIGPGQDRYRLTYDDAGRPVRREAWSDGAWVVVGSWLYTPEGRLTQATSRDGERAVVTRFDAWDAQGRPTSRSVEIPDPLSAPTGLLPDGQVPAARAFPLLWSHDASLAEYRVELRPKGRTSTLRFSVDLPWLLLDDTPRGALLSTVGQLDGNPLQIWSAMVEPSGPYLLDPRQDFEWRVRGLTAEGEPSLWSPWAVLTNGCHFESFGVEPGINQAPRVEWRTANCPETGSYSVRIHTSTEDLADDRCELHDGLFSGSKQGPRPAHFMASGYNYDDVLAAHQDFPIGYQMILNGPKDCAPLDRATFRGEIVDLDTGDAVDRTLSAVARVVHDPEACAVESFYLNHGYGGEAPSVTWKTRRCEAHHVVVKATTHVGTVPPECHLTAEPLWTGPAGSRTADFLVNGWASPIDGQACGPGSGADFWLEVHSDPSESGTPLLRRQPMPGFVDPPDDGRCHVRFFDVASSAAGPPVVRYETRHCEGLDIRLMASSLHGQFEPGCRLREFPVASNLAAVGPYTARFMAEGYSVEGQACASLAGAELWLEVLDAQSVLRASSQILPAFYHGPAVVGDLLPSSFDSSRLLVEPGELVVATYTVTSTGGVAFGPFRDRLYLSTDAELDADDRPLSTRTRSGFPADSQRTYAFDVQLLATAPGDYFLLVEVDAEQDLTEADEDNNVVAVRPVRVLDPACAPPPTMGAPTVSPLGQLCGAWITWSPASASCGHEVTYNLYRGSHPSVQASDTYRIARGLGVLGHHDWTLADGGRYYYLITAVDATTGVESVPAAPVSLALSCSGGVGGGGGPSSFLAASAGTLPSVPVAAGTPITLSWDFPGAESVFLVGFGHVGTSGERTVWPTATTVYEAHVDFYGNGLTSYTATVHVAGSAVPEAGEPCDRPCSDAYEIGGVLHYCRGVEAQAPGQPVMQTPIWLAISDWVDIVGPEGDPVSPYCNRATCGDGSYALYSWRTPHDIPENWTTREYLDAHKVEILGDGLDNDCDQVID